MIELCHVSKTYGDVTPLNDVNVTINRGDVIAVIGPSGSGKSTLIRSINMLTKPSSGQVFIDGEEITAKGADVERLRQRCGMVFQQFNLFGHLTVLENVCEPQIHILKRSPQDACDYAMKCLRAVGMDKLIYSYPDALSGGQKQRVAIARTLACDPECILFDEPTSALDPSMVAEVEFIIKKLADEGRTMVIVTHEMEFAKRIANRVLYVDQGCIYEEGTVDQIFEHPQKERTRRFIKQLSSIEMTLKSDNASFMEILSTLQGFCDKRMLSGRVKYKAELFMEELIFNTLRPKLGEDDSINIFIENAQNIDDISIEATGGAIKSNLIEEMDSISKTLVQRSVKSFTIEDGRLTALISSENEVKK